jgi:very-short-patch-repair endonuclease
VRSYVLDFYCPEAPLAIEVDGIAHNMGDRPRRDLARDEWLASPAIKTLRFAAVDVPDEFEVVISAILRECRTRSSPEG